MFLAKSALAQTQGVDPAAAEAARTDAIKRREQELEAARTEQREAAEREKKLRDEVTALGADRTQLNRQLIDTATNVRTIETKIGDAEKRIVALDDREVTIRQSLEARRDEIAEVLAALQRAGRRPPPALLVRPEDALQSLRTAMLLGAVVPDMRGRAEKLVDGSRRAAAAAHGDRPGENAARRGSRQPRPPTRSASRCSSRNARKSKPIPRKNLKASATAPHRSPGRSTTSRT